MFSRACQSGDKLLLLLVVSLVSEEKPQNTRSLVAAVIIIRAAGTVYLMVTASSMSRTDVGTAYNGPTSALIVKFKYLHV